MIEDDPAPHRFAQGLSGATTLVSAVLVAAGIAAGWALAWLVVALAGLNVFAGVCAQLLHLPPARAARPGRQRRARQLI